MAAPTIVEVHPSSNASGVVLSDTIRVLFDQEVDHETVSIVLEGPDTDRWSGPDQALFDDPTTTTDDQILESPGYRGIVAGKLSFNKVDAGGADISSPIYDYTGAGAAWRTEAIFTPDIPLSPGVEYRVYVIGDEQSNDEIKSGVSSRTVFDTVKGANLGDGELEITGGYTGLVDDKIFIEILDTGAAGDITFRWYLQSNPLVARVLTSSQTSQLLADGVYVRFIDGTFQTGDTYSAVLKTPDRMLNTYTWIFTTGSGSIQTVPSTPASSGASGDIFQGLSTSVFKVISTDPKAYATNLSPEEITAITIRFSANLDSNTVNDNTVLVWSEPVNGDAETCPAAGDLAKILAISGDTLTITIG